MAISQLLSQPHQMHPGGAARYIEGLAAALAAIGHTPLTIRGYLDSAVRFGGGWKRAGSTSPTSLNRPFRHSEHMTANVLEAGVGGKFHVLIRHLFSASWDTYANRVPSQGLGSSHTEPTSPLPASRDWLLRPLAGGHSGRAR
jgi:hypothetical protein